MCNGFTRFLELLGDHPLENEHASATPHVLGESAVLTTLQSFVRRTATGGSVDGTPHLGASGRSIRMCVPFFPVGTISTSPS